MVPPLTVTWYVVKDVLVLVIKAVNRNLLSVCTLGVLLSKHNRLVGTIALILQQLVGVVSVTLQLPVQPVVVFVTVTV